jgi:O-antigen ligase
MIAAVISMGLDMIMLVFNRSLGCLIAAAAVLVVMLLVSMVRGQGRRRSFILTICIIAASAAALVCSPLLRVDLYFTFREAILIMQGKGNQYMGHGRWRLWELTAEYIRQRPLFGYGCEGINERLYAGTAAINGVSNPHCEPLTYAAFFGIPAALFYIAGCVTAIVKGLRSSNNKSKTANCSTIAAYAAAAYFISSLFGVAMFYTAPFFFILLGISAGAENKEGLLTQE